MAGVKRKLKRKTQPQGVHFPELDKMLLRMDELIREGLRNKQEFMQLEASILEYMKKRGIKEYDTDDIRAPIVTGHTTLIDWEGIRADVDDPTWEQLLEPPQPSAAKLDAAVQLGIVSTEVVDAHITERENKSWVRPTIKKKR